MKNAQLNLDCINIIKGLAYSQMLLQDERSALINSGYFNDDEAFSQIDRKNVGKLYTNELIDYLSVHRIAISQRQAQYLIWNAGSKQSFITFEQFKIYMTNGQPQLLDRMQSSVLSKNMQTGDEVMKSYSQRQLAKLFQKQIEYYRAIQLLRQQFFKKYGNQLKNIISNIDKERSGHISFDSLIKFIHQHGVEFSIEQFQAFGRKINSKHYDTISIKQMIRSLSPFQPLNFPTYRKQSNIQKAMDYINQQVQKLQIDTNYLPAQEQDHRTKKSTTGFKRVVQDMMQTANRGTQTNKYFYDKNYYNELRQYKTSYFDPNKDIKKKYQNQSNMIGPQYHDHFFSDYYMYLDERNKTEHYYNKFGKRYTFQNPITKTMDLKL